MPSTVSLGSTGDDVKRVQRVLGRMAINVPAGPITGVFDIKLQNAVESFQQGAGLTVDGIVGPATWAALPAYREASPTVQLGSTGPVVAWIQQAMANPNFASDQIALPPYTGPIDGIFGLATDAVVRAFQTFSGLTADGVVGDDTWFSRVRLGSATEATLEDD